MKQIVIYVSEEDSLADACRVVANEIDNGNTNGIIGWSGDTWYVEDLTDVNN